MYFMLEDYLSAETHWQEAYNQNALIGMPDLTASIGNNLGKVYTKLKEYEAGEQILLESLTLFDQLGDIPRWANCMDNLADLYEEMGEFAAFKRTLEQAIARLEPQATMDHSQKLLQGMQQRLKQIPDN
jgi:tetratricopeptide (TPR) repeat protein